MGAAASARAQQRKEAEAWDIVAAVILREAAKKKAEEDEKERLRLLELRKEAGKLVVPYGALRVRCPSGIGHWSRKKPGGNWHYTF